MNPLILAIDFDGTIIEKGHWPKCPPSPMDGAKDVLRLFHSLGMKIIIHTCRCEEALEEAKIFLAKHKIPYDVINKNTPEMVKFFKGDPRKVFANVYIDDNSLHPLPSWPDIYEMVLDINAERILNGQE